MFIKQEIRRLPDSELNLTDHFLIVTTLGKNSHKTAYCLRGGVDWAHIQSLLKPEK